MKSIKDVKCSINASFSVFVSISPDDNCLRISGNKVVQLHKYQEACEFSCAMVFNAYHETITEELSEEDIEWGVFIDSEKGRSVNVTHDLFIDISLSMSRKMKSRTVKSQSLIVLHSINGSDYGNRILITLLYNQVMSQEMSLLRSGQVTLTAGRSKN